MPNTVSIDSVAQAPSITDQTQPATTSTKPEADASKNNKPNEAHENVTENNNYVAERIVGHIGEGDTLCYVVRWYGYRPKNDAIEPAHHIPQNFITCCWRRINGKNKDQRYTTE